MYDYQSYILNQLGAKNESGVTYGSLKTRCPNHDDKNASLSVTIKPDGRILLFCQAGCRTDDVLRSANLGFEDLEPPRDGMATPSFRNKVYIGFLGLIQLFDTHREELRKRGLSDRVISDWWFRSLSVLSCTQAHNALIDEGFDLSGVPGLRDLPITDGLAIPVRDHRGFITALQVRRDYEPKYIWFSERGRMGSVPVHVARFGADDSALVVEGVLKADVVTALSGYSGWVLGIPGASSWPRLFTLPFWDRLQEINLAFDMDWMHNKGVRNALDSCEREIRKKKKRSVVWTWDTAYKGLDDFLLKNSLEQVERHDRWQESSTEGRQVRARDSLFTSETGYIRPSRPLVGVNVELSW